MKIGLRLAVTSVLALSVAGAVAAVGCTSSSSGGSGGNGAGASEYCSALSSYVSKCNIVDPCTTATLQNCGTYAASFSSAYLAAVASCSQEISCDGGGPATACYEAARAGLTPSAAQEKLAQDYCATCAVPQQTAAECAQTFYASGDGSLGGLGALYLLYNDSIASSIDTQCTPGLADGGLFSCDFALLFCGEGVISKSAPLACGLSSDAGTFVFDSGPIGVGAQGDH